MVTVSGFAERQRKDGSPFITLELTGSVEIVESQTTGKMYATVRKVSIPSTFDASIAQAMIGQKIEGEIVRVICEPYEFTNPRTGEVIKLQHSWAYQPNEQAEPVGITKMSAFQLKA